MCFDYLLFECAEEYMNLSKKIHIDETTVIQILTLGVRIKLVEQFPNNRLIIF